MSPRLILALLGPLLLAGAPVARAESSTQSQLHESENPINDQGSNYNYRSVITSVTPSVPGLQLEVLEFADRLVLTNHTGKTVTVYGYQGEPYARVLPSGTVQVNTRSPAYFLNQNFYGQVSVPPSASPSAKPDWSEIDRTGELEWHDHRIHWMSPVPPPQVKNTSKRTKIFDWQVPIRVGTSAGTIDGELLWVPEGNSKAPLAAILALVVVVLAAIVFVLFVRRRRTRQAPPGPGQAAEAPASKEVW
ncbi:MAG: hypothetical protein ACRDK2_16910 [Solirubrobacteraceae bacterium]